MKFKRLLLLFLFPFLSCSNAPYDTSTPEKFVISLGQIGQQSEDHNPLPYFYEKEYADSILAFDNAAEGGLSSFNQFRNAIATKFPTFVKTNEVGKIKIVLDDSSSFDTRSFTYSASMIGAQMKERTPTDYEFVSATEPDKDGISQLKVKILGKLTTIPIKRTKDGFRMFPTQKTLEGISKSIKKVNKMNDVFVTGTKQVESGEIDTQNFKEKMEAIFKLYFDAIR